MIKRCPRNLILSFGFALWIAFAAVEVGRAQAIYAHSGKGDPVAIRPGDFSFSDNREPVISLDGLWRFHPGDDSHWALPDFDDSAWPMLRSDQPWTVQGYASLSRFAWYRFRVETPNAGISHSSLALILPSILTDYELFQNGRKIGAVGRMPPHGSLRFNQTLLYHLDPAPPGATLQFAIRVWHHPVFATYLGGGPRYSGARLGEDTLLENQFRSMEGERLNRVASFYAIGILNGVISITVLGLYLYRRSEREYLWFAILLLASASLSGLAVTSFLVNFSQGVSDFTAELLGAIGVSASLFFFSKVLEAKRSWLWYSVLVIAILDPLNVLLYVLRVLSPATTTSMRILFEIPIVLYIVVLLCKRAISGNRNARLLFVPTILLYGTAILGGALLLTFQLGWQSATLASIHQWNVLERPFPVPLQVFVQLVFVVALLAFLIRRFARSRAQEERFAADIEAARMIQNLLIPETLPSIPNLEILAAYHPAQEVGGDFYQIIPLFNSALSSRPDTLIVLGDVAGKGLPAAMTVSLLIGALRSLAETTSSPGEILAGLNRRLAGRASGFTTCIAVRLSPAGTLTVANAGHLLPYRNGQELTVPPALPLGFDSKEIFHEVTSPFEPGDRLTLLTDGVPEAARQGELFGFERTVGVSLSPANVIAATALAFGQSDDITVISVVAGYKN